MGPTPAVWNTSDCLAASCGTMVKVWTPNDAGSEIKIFEGTAVYSIDFSRNNKVLAVAGDKSQVVMYSSKPQAPNGDRAVGRFPSIPQDTIDAITCVRFSPSDAHLVGGCKNGSVHIWALKAKDDAHVVTGLSGAATSVAVSPNMEVLATASSAGHVLLHDFKTGAKWKSLLCAGGPAAGSLSFSKHAPALAAATAAGQLLVWDMDRLELTHDLLVHKGAVTGLSFSEASPELLLSCSSDGTFKCTDRRTQKAVWSASSRSPSCYTALSAKHDGNLLAVGTSSGSVLVHDIRAVHQALAAQQFSDTSASVTAVRWQHLHHSRSSRAASAATTSAAVSAAAPAASTAVTSAATGPRRQQQQPLLEQRAPAGAVPADSVGGGSSHAVGDAPSTSASLDLGVRAFSPVQMYGSPSSEADSATPAATVASILHTPDGPLAAAAGAAPASTSTPVLATPADSMTSGPACGTFMFTPGIGLAQFGGASANTTPVLGATADLTPMSRPLMAAAAGINAAPPLPAPEAAPAAAEGGRLSRRNNSSSSAAADSRPASAAAAGGKPAGRAPLPSAAAAGGNFHAPNTTAAAAAAAAGSTVSGRGAASRSGSSSSLAAAAPSGGSRPGSRPGTAGASGAGATAAGSKRPTTAASDSAAEPAAAAGSGPGSRPGSAAPAGAAQPAAAAPAAADSVRGADGAPSRPGSAAAGASLSGVAGGGLREDVFKAYVDQQMAELRQVVKNMHLDMLRQFHQAQMDLVSVVDGLVQRQDQLAEAVGELTAAVHGMRSAAKQQQPGLGMMPWI